MLREETSTFAHIHHFERQKFCNKNMESIISNSLESLRIVLNSLEKTYAELRSMQIDAMTLLPTRWWENRCEIQNLSGVLFGNMRLLRDFCTQQNIVEKHGLGFILLINRLIQQLKASSMWSLLPPFTHLHERFFLHSASMVGSCLIYKLGELTGQGFKRSFCSLPTGNSLNSALKPTMPLEFQTTLTPHAF